MRISGFLSGLGLILTALFFNSCTGVDIYNEQAVIQEIQGTWTGYEKTGNLHRHIKLNISGNRFEGWMQTSDSDTVPEWTILPTEQGTFSLSTVEDTKNAGAFRKLSFAILNRCCGDNSLTAKMLSSMITYHEDKGLLVAGRVSMTKN